MPVIDNPQTRGVSLTPAGTTQATADRVTRKHAQTDTSFTQGAGVILQEETCFKFEWGTLFNACGAAGATSTGQSLLVYPWSGASFNGQTADQPLTLPAGMGVMWVYLNSTKIGLIYS